MEKYFFFSLHFLQITILTFRDPHALSNNSFSPKYIILSQGLSGSMAASDLTPVPVEATYEWSTPLWTSYSVTCSQEKPTPHWNQINPSSLTLPPSAGITEGLLKLHASFQFPPTPPKSRPVQLWQLSLHVKVFFF
jgi:hypothetical protein